MSSHYYSPSIYGFFNADIHASEQIPSDAIAISKALYEELRDGQSGLKRIAIDADGLPALVDVDVDADELAANRERYWRDTELSRLQWMRERHRDEMELSSPTSLNPDQYSELLAYLQLLRDWPQSDDFPAIEQRPVAPPWIAEQTQ